MTKNGSGATRRYRCDCAWMGGSIYVCVCVCMCACVPLCMKAFFDFEDTESILP